MKDLKRASDIAQASEFIEAKPDKYSSEISQGGTNVSGGQKQRLSIARALVKKPEIYVFDDSFSALDFKTDSALRKAIKENIKDATMIIVAQRISTIKDANQIIVLDEGEVVGIGTHRDLIENCEVYQANSFITTFKGGTNVMSNNLGGKKHGGFGGPMGGMKFAGGKAKDFKGTFKKLLNYLKPYRISIIIVLIFAIGSAAFSIIGPKILGKATTKLFEGLVSKISGEANAGIDFTYIGNILVILIVLYAVSAIFAFIQGFIMSGIAQKVSYNLRKEISLKINKMPLKYFDKMTHGEVLSRSN